MTSEKASAYEFLTDLNQFLNERMAEPKAMEEAVNELIKLGQVDPKMKHLCSPEHAFTRGIAMPLVNKFLIGSGLSQQEACESLLMEGWANYKLISSNTPARAARHPFDKAVVTDPMKIYAKWSGGSSRLPLTQSCPDFALRSPCPHKVVFESKYFRGGSTYKAQKELVTDLYQAFFYRGLPANYDNPKRPWDYDYSCLFVFDASADGAFIDAWERLPSQVREGLWDGANVYTMVIRGQGA